ncbi:MAG TPA: ParB/RepB/Spo0J family partition protein [Candidatus Saccharimonadales bacterium]|nr:ParB/RepB/Spo0J family partition protein [Candidatus Saccharimonadales bacterium]
MAAKQTGLGRGFGSLLPQSFDAGLLTAEDGERIQKLDIAKLHPNPDQPRTIFDESALAELSESIKRYGVVQPIVASPREGGGDAYIIIAGERRWRASQLAGLKTVPVLVRTSKELEQLEIALVENVQRVDLSPLEQAVSIERLHQQFNLAYGEIAKRLGKAETTVHNIVRLLQLPEDARQALHNKEISEGHARQVLALKDLPDQQAELLKLIVQNGWSVRQAERYVSSLKAGVKEAKKTAERVTGDTPETERLSQRFGTKVRIHRTAKGGRVEIGFTTDEQLARLLSDLEQ